MTTDFNHVKGAMQRMTESELTEYKNFGIFPSELKRPTRPFFKKSGMEYGPTWGERKEFVHKLIYDSRVDPATKVKLKENFELIAHFQFRGFKYGCATSAMVFFLLPVVRRQLFLRRFAISMIPMAVFLKYGHTWGHEHWWRKSMPYISSYEVGIGTRSRFSGK